MRNRATPRTLVAALCALLLAGCSAETPRVQDPTEAGRILAAPLADTWRAVDAAVRAMSADVIARDEDSGVVTFAFMDTDVNGHVYITLLLREVGPGQTAVYYFPRIRSGAYFTTRGTQFFDDVEARLGRHG